MAVNSTHSEYDEYSPLWKVVRDCVKGEPAIKAGGADYLPKPTGKGDASYKRYLDRTHFSNFTGRTAEGLHGNLFSREAERPEGISERFRDFLENVDNAGASVGRFTRELAWDVLQTGWGGILADYSRLPDGQTIDVATASRLRLTAYLKWYAAENIINWRYDTVDERRTLSLVVLQETFEDTSKDEFAPSIKTRYRVLRLAGGVYTQQEYERIESRDRNVKGEFFPGPVITPQMGGEPFDYIPFFLCPSNTPEKSMLIDLAYENIGHYQKSADLENALHYSGTPTPWMSVDSNALDRNPDGTLKDIPLGGEVMLHIPPDAKLGFLEPSGQGIAHIQRAIEASEIRMKVLGAKPFDGGPKGVESGKAASIHSAAANSVLGAFAVNMGEVITNAVRLGARWNGITDAEAEKWNFNLNTIYDGDIAKVEEKRLALEMIDDGVMSRVKFLIDYMGMEEADAKAEVERIREEEGYPALEE